jgi:broad specificity phosphatase PhoE
VVHRLWRLHAARWDQAFVVVSHGATIQISARAMLGHYRTPRYVPNTGRVVLVPTGGADCAGEGAATGWELERWDRARDAGVPDARGDVTGGAGEPDDAPEPDEKRAPVRPRD